jgi:hypothetical protein
VDEKEKLDEALSQLDTALRLWGVDNWLGYRTYGHMKLSANGACNLVELVDKMTDEIGRLSVLVGKLAVSQ